MSFPQGDLNVFAGSILATKRDGASVEPSFRDYQPLLANPGQRVESQLFTTSETARGNDALLARDASS